MIAWFKLALSQWNNFQGRSRRSEYWYYTLVLVIIFVVLAVLAAVAAAALGDVGKIIALVINIVYLVVALATLVPSIAVSIRRLHDTGRSGWWLLLSFVPLGGLVVLYFFCLDGEPAANKWGPNPKAVGAPMPIGITT